MNNIFSSIEIDQKNQTWKVVCHIYIVSSVKYVYDKAIWLFSLNSSGEKKTANKKWEDI
jgi:hypothetical protein